jgi:hypothetical protein
MRGVGEKAKKKEWKACQIARAQSTACDAQEAEAVCGGVRRCLLGDTLSRPRASLRLGLPTANEAGHIISGTFLFHRINLKFEFWEYPLKGCFVGVIN